MKPLLVRHKVIRTPNRPRSISEDGQTLALFAITAVALAAFIGLALDGGYLFVQRRQMQNAADAAAMAGGRSLALEAGDADIESAIQEYSQGRNGASTVSATYTPGGESVGGGSVPSGAIGVSVTTTVTWPSFFIQLIGVPDLTVNASSTSAMGLVSSPDDLSLQPLARHCITNNLEDCGFEFGQEYDIWQGGGPGNFGWLTWNGDNSVGKMAEELEPTYRVTDYVDPVTDCPSVAVDCWVQGSPGVQDASGIRDQLDRWIALGAEGKPMVIVIYDTAEDGGSNTDYHVVGFGAFLLTSYDLSGQHIVGRFQRFFLAGTTGGQVFDAGVKSVRLVR